MDSTLYRYAYGKYNKCRIFWYSIHVNACVACTSLEAHGKRSRKHTHASQGIYDLPPNASSVLRALAQRTAAANARRPSEFSLQSFFDSGSLGYKSLELFKYEGIEEKRATFTLMIGGGQTAAQVNASMDAFAAALNKSVHKENLYTAGASLNVRVYTERDYDFGVNFVNKHTTTTAKHVQ